MNFLEFTSVKFRKIWQTVNKYYTIVGARKNCLCKPDFFRVKIRIPVGAMSCKNLKFYFSRSSFSREIYKTSFLAAVKDINLNKKKCIYKPYFFRA